MSVEENKALLRKYFSPELPPEIMRKIKEGEDPMKLMIENAKNNVEDIFSPDCIIHAPGDEFDREGLIKFNMSYFDSFQDLIFSLEHILAEGDMVAYHARIQAKHTGPYKGVPATGKKVDAKYMGLWHIAEGKVIEAWAYGGESDILRQLTEGK